MVSLVLRHETSVFMPVFIETRISAIPTFYLYAQLRSYEALTLTATRHATRPHAPQRTSHLTAAWHLALDGPPARWRGAPPLPSLFLVFFSWSPLFIRLLSRCSLSLSVCSSFLVLPRGSGFIICFIPGFDEGGARSIGLTTDIGLLEEF